MCVCVCVCTVCELMLFASLNFVNCNLDKSKLDLPMCSIVPKLATHYPIRVIDCLSTAANAISFTLIQ